MARKSKTLTSGDVERLISKTLSTASLSSQPKRRANRVRAGRNMSARCNRITGSEQLATIGNSDYAGNTAVQVLSLDAEGFSNLRLIDYFPMYEYWFVHNMWFEFIPVLSKTSEGSIHIVPEWDPLDATPTGSTDEVTLRKMAASYGYKSASISETCNVNMPNFKLPSGEWIKGNLFTGPLAETRLSSFGKLFIKTTGVDGSTDAVGQLVMHYDVEFALPQKGESGVAWVASGLGIDGIELIDSNSILQDIGRDRKSVV